MLPGIDDGAGDLDVSLRMARAAVDQGITVVACTPHILPGLYHNSGPAIRQAITQLQEALKETGLPPPHPTAPPHIEEVFFNLVAAGYVPILTHPERLSWVPSRYDVIKRLARGGVWMQITSGSFTGAFGDRE